MPIYMQVDGIVAKPKAQPYPGANSLVNQIRQSHPRGVDLILIGQSSKEKFVQGTTNKGIIAILIGLLLPAVQKFEGGAHGDMALLKGALRPTGQIAVALGDGSVRPVGAAAGRPVAMVFEEITWT